MMSNEDKLNLELQKMTVEAINAYCRVLEIHIKAVEQGANPLLKGKLGDAVAAATGELVREVELLRFLRNGAIGMERQKGSPES